MTSSEPRKNIPSPNEAARGAYARFIPREELGGFAAWQPGDLAGGPAPDRSPGAQAANELSSSRGMKRA